MLRNKFWVWVVMGLCSTSASQGQTIASGATPTIVSVDASGKVTVSVANPSIDGVSLNKYTKFNVPTAGTDLDNRGAAARTIVNEVTGTDITAINGKVEVLGQKAHVIIANQSGIQVSGGAFVNTGRVALTTGAIDINAREIAPGIFQENITSTVNGGTIEIGQGGLSGSMDMLDLVAHKIRIGGVVENTNTNVLSAVNVVAGKSEAEFDSSVVPGNLNQNWEAITSRGTSGNDQLFELTLPGAIRANHIDILVTEAGAGARLAGSALATSREFRLSTKGDIEFSGAEISAPGNVLVSGRAIKTSKSKIESTARDINVVATAAIEDTESSFTAYRDLRFLANGPVTLTDTQALAYHQIALDAKSGLIATNAVFTAAQDIMVRADEITLSYGEFVSAEGALNVQTLGNVSGGNLNVTGTLLQGAQQTLARLDGDMPAPQGAVTFSIAGDFDLKNEGDKLGIVFGSAGDVALEVGGTLTNNSGRILSNGDLKIAAVGDILNVIDLPGASNTPTVTQYTTKGKRQWWTLWLKRKVTTYQAYDFGTVADPEHIATMTSAGNVSLSGNRVVNRGGEINANGGDIEITAVDIETEGVGSGRLVVTKVCVLTCRYVTEGDDIQIIGGRMNAVGDAKLTASNQIKVVGGTILAQNNVDLTANSIELQATLVPSIGYRPAGLYNFWSSKAAWIMLRDQFGNVIADAGNITVNSPNAVNLSGTRLQAGGGVIAPNGVTTLYEPRTISDNEGQYIGLFRNIEPVKQ